MHWIIFHIKHTAASQCSIIHIAVWAMRKEFQVFFPHTCTCRNTEWKMGIMHGMGVAYCPFEGVWLPWEW